MTEAARVLAVGTEPVSAGDPADVKKVIVAVHGIGEQTNYGTIQAVLNQFCAYKGQPAGIPLGNFYRDKGVLAVGSPYPKDVFDRFAFAEVYWAVIPRQLVQERYRLEETKKWARTIVERLRLRCNQGVKEAMQRLGAEAGPAQPDFPLVKQILGELILTLAILDRLSFIADKAGLFTFDLKRLLEDYLGDVQVVAEFDEQRESILSQFDQTMTAVQEKYPDNAEIYIVAHSEGTVVAMLGLLRAFRDTTPAWADRVRGLMTLGSPIDKHLILWPELFGEGPPRPRVPRPPATKPPPPIDWRNYYDFGDPIGFDLDGVRDWITRNGWESVFHFPREHDYGFSRYALPGKAHVDYWEDDAVFGHFLNAVVREKPAVAEHGYAKPPRTRWVTPFISFGVPALLIAGLLLLASYILVKAVATALLPSDAAGVGTHAADISKVALAVRATGIAALLFGMTALNRIPRLTRRWSWRAGALAVALGAYLLFQWSVTSPLGAIPQVPEFGSDRGSLWIVLAATLAGWFATERWPKAGIKPLFAIGGGAIVGRVAYTLYSAAQRHEIGPLWPVAIALAVCVYLWWLSALLLDLVAVWTLYIRNYHIRAGFARMTGAERDATVAQKIVKACKDFTTPAGQGAAAP